MILSREEIKELQHDEQIELVMPRSLEPGAERAIQTGVGVPSIGKMRVLDSWPHRDGGFVVLFELASKIRPVAGHKRTRGGDPVRLMKRGHGTTKDPKAAWRDRTSEEWDETLGAPPEPEMIEEKREQEYADQARKNDDLRGMASQKRTLLERLDRTMEGAERLGVDATRHIAAIERRVDQLERKLKRAA